MKVLLGVADVIDGVAGVHAGVSVCGDAGDREDVLPADVADPDPVRRLGLVRESSPVPVPEHGRPKVIRRSVIVVWLKGNNEIFIFLVAMGSMRLYQM